MIEREMERKRKRHCHASTEDGNADQQLWKLERVRHRFFPEVFGGKKR